MLLISFGFRIQTLDPALREIEESGREHMSETRNNGKIRLVRHSNEHIWSGEYPGVGTSRVFDRNRQPRQSRGV
jgi:hypothetical protein